MPTLTSSAPDVTFRVEIGTGGVETAGSEWDDANWDEGFWDGRSVTWEDVTTDVLSVTTDFGKDAFGKRYRTGRSTIVMTNLGGQWTAGAGLGDPGNVRLRPGRAMRVSARYQLGEWVPLFYGRIDTLNDSHTNGNVTTTIYVYDALAGFAVDDETAEQPQGAGELSGVRINKILDKNGWLSNRRDIQPGVVTMQATTYAQSALAEMQITSDSEGGDLWVSQAGDVTFRSRDWLVTDPRSTTPQWQLGGIGVGIVSASPQWTMQRVVNYAEYAVVGSTAQLAQDLGSIQTYGRRTYRRLDLIAEEDSQATYLAQRTVATLKYDAVRISQVSLVISDEQKTMFALGVQIGDMTLVTIDTIWGWAQTVLVHVIGIGHHITPSAWTVTVMLENAGSENVNGGFRYDAFSEGYALGGHP